jgi:hypothetical protein
MRKSWSFFVLSSSSAEAPSGRLHLCRAHLDDLLGDSEPEAGSALCLGRETVDGDSVAPSREPHVQVAFSRVETRSDASTCTRRPPTPARPKAPLGRGTASNDGTTGAAKLDRPGKPTMTDKPRIILDAKAWQEGFAVGRRGLKWNANPYPVGTDASRSWRSGLLEGQTKRLQSVDDQG